MAEAAAMLPSAEDIVEVPIIPGVHAADAVPTDVSPQRMSCFAYSCCAVLISQAVFDSEESLIAAVNGR